MVDGVHGGAAAGVPRLDMVVVGAGFAGLYMLHRARAMGLSVQAFEAGAGVGGTWYWNRYPGARCDVESLEYSYQFSDALEQEWQWTERFAAQPEILAYANHVADRFALRELIRFETRVLAAHFDERRHRFAVEGFDRARDRVDGQQVVGYVLSDLTVPSRGTALELAVAVQQRDSEPVDLRFADVGEVGVVDAFTRKVVAHPLGPRMQLLG